MLAEKFSCSEVCLYRLFSTTFGDGVALEYDNQALAGAAGGFVTDIGDAAEFAVVDQFGDLDRQLVRVGMIGQFGDDQCGAVLDLLRR